MDELARVALEQGDFDEARRQFEAALAYFRTKEYEQRVANTLADLGYAALGQAEYEEARVAFEESLRQCSELGWKSNIAADLVGLAQCSRRRLTWSARLGFWGRSKASSKRFIYN
jgi:tetratricopeptide (TPR) repeat protein